MPVLTPPTVVPSRDRKQPSKGILKKHDKKVKFDGEEEPMHGFSEGYYMPAEAQPIWAMQGWMQYAPVAVAMYGVPAMLVQESEAGDSNLWKSEEIREVIKERADKDGSYTRDTVRETRRSR